MSGDTIKIDELIKKTARENNDFESKIAAAFAEADKANEADNANIGTLPVSLSIETENSMLIRVANIGDRLPIKATKVFSTGNDIPDALAVRLYAGERPFAKDNRLIAELMLDGIKGLSYGRPVISIVVDIDLDRNIVIEATDEGSLTSASADIGNEWVPSADEIVNMVKDAKSNATPDSIRISKARKLHVAKESLCKAENEYKSAKKKLAGEDILKYRKYMKELRARLKKVRPENMTDDIEKSIMDAAKKLNELVYPDETSDSE